jgi:hypothetical protein
VGYSGGDGVLESTVRKQSVFFFFFRWLRCSVDLNLPQTTTSEVDQQSKSRYKCRAHTHGLGWDKEADSESLRNIIMFAHGITPPLTRLPHVHIVTRGNGRKKKKKFKLKKINSSKASPTIDCKPGT